MEEQNEGRVWGLTLQGLMWWLRAAQLGSLVPVLGV